MQFTKALFHRADNTCQNVSELLDFGFAWLKQKDAFIFNKKHSHTLISLATSLCLEEIL